ncbi:uncharacterized protein LOC143849432 [Tasmannia lanceolata]|uniref:uncharacterized protein LOC143849432 n=1 Tax=Tasmannia lanceolata TaxID=3420 RepID=UPI00406316F8
MDNSVMGGGILSGRGAGILELEPSIHRHQHHHLAQMPFPRHHHTPTMGAMTSLENDHSKGIPMNCVRGKGLIAPNASNNTSEEDEPSFTDGNDVNFNWGKGKKGSPWQRMKWTDNIVRLLITVVSYVEEDCIPESVDGPKRKSGVLQKKGKWKTVSRIMMERGHSVSPQQCEDKFNDLNKRYKRLNEILGRGTTCRVVENPLLLDSMSDLTPKLKDDVRKILSSKHLFYKEMCAYHNGQRIPNVHDLELHSYSVPIVRCSEDGNAFEEEVDEENEECDDDVDNEDDANGYGNVERVVDFGKKKVSEEDGSFWSQSGVHDGFGDEINGVLQDTTKSPLEQREWIRSRILQLQEQGLSIQTQAFELEKRRFKWQRFCSKKDRELERLRLENERLKLENERMALQLKHNELEIDFKRSEPLMNAVAVGMDRLQGRDQIDLGSVQ